MSKTSAQINKLIKLLAKQLRFAESFEMHSSEKAKSCKKASIIVSQLETIGITFKESFMRVEEINQEIEKINRLQEVTKQSMIFPQN